MCKRRVSVGMWPVPASCSRFLQQLERTCKGAPEMNHSMTSRRSTLSNWGPHLCMTGGKREDKCFSTPRSSQAILVTSFSSPRQPELTSCASVCPSASSCMGLLVACTAQGNSQLCTPITRTMQRRDCCVRSCAYLYKAEQPVSGGVHLKELNVPGNVWVAKALQSLGFSLEQLYLATSSISKASKSTAGCTG